MKKYGIYALAALALMAGACSRDMTPELPEGNGIVLQLLAADPATRAGNSGTQAGSAAFNENALGNYVDIFFFRSNASDATPCVKSVRAEVPYTGRVVLETSASELSTIFGTTVGSPTCKVFVVANNNAAAFDHSRTPRYSMGELNAIVLDNAVWGTTAPSDNPNFVMTGEASVPLAGVNVIPPVQATITMQRIASKVTFSVTVEDEIEVTVYKVDTEGNRIKVLDGGGNWTGEYETESVTMMPNKAGMSVNLCYANKRGTIGGTAYEPTGKDDLNLFDYGYRNFTASGTTYTAEPFYSYPQKWNTGAPNQPYIKLVIPWARVKDGATSSTRNYYYKISLPEGELLRNTWYQISLDVSILGGVDTLPLDLDLHYAVVPWNSDSGYSSTASVVSSRYLSVPRTEYTLYNEESLSIPYDSSHDCSFEILTSTDYTFQPTYTGLSAGKKAYSSFTETVSIVFSSTGSKSINFSHTLHNDISTPSTLDYAPYTITFKVYHTDMASEPGHGGFEEEIVVHQYPAIIITPEANTCFNVSSEANYNYDGSGTSYGYVRVNNSTSSGFTNVKGISRPSTSGNNNPYRYIISTSVLTAGSGYVLGDPRDSKEYSTFGNNTFTSATALYGTSPRSLSYYHPTDESSLTQNMVSPAFMIASSYGGWSGTGTYANAKDRCAAYQEDGYPAGRWRVPTEAEIKYIKTLSENTIIPVLFFSGTAYWSAHGGVNNGKNTGWSDPCSVRCVYDTWYWGDDKITPGTTFIWGDKPSSTD